MVYLAYVDFDYLDSVNISIKDDSYIDSVVLLELDLVQCGTFSCKLAA